MSADEEPDIMAECLRLASEPYKSVIWRRQQEGWFGTVLDEFQKRYTLSEDQLDTVTIAAFQAACAPDSLDSLKDILISVADLSYEQAVKIQRDIARDIIFPIKEEGDRILGSRQDGSSRAGISPRVDDQLFHDDGVGITVTAKLLKYRAQTFPTRSITNVSAFEGPFEFKNLLINAIVALIGIPIILSFSFWSLLGLGMVAMGVFNVKDIVTKKYIVTVEIQGVDDLRFEFTDKSRAIALRDALQEGMSTN